MEFGWLTLALSPSPEEDEARIDQQIAQVCYAEELGFSDVWLTEHYFTGESVYNDAVLFASALAMRTERIRIGFAVVQMPFHHPIRLAVQLATAVSEVVRICQPPAMAVSSQGKPEVSRRSPNCSSCASSSLIV